MDGLGGPQGGPARHGPDIFAEFFGGGGIFGFDFGSRSRPSQRHKGEDSVIPYDVTLEDLYNGKTVKMNMEKEVVCSGCKGSGARGNAKPKPCVNCEGKGCTFTKSQIAPSRLGTSRVKCSECDGQGEKLRPKDKCKRCKGEKTVQEKTRQEIFIERGMSDGQRIVLAGSGDQEPGIPAGDVIFVLRAAPHDSFERSGNDLITNVTITLSEALLGFSRILITHLDGRGIKVSSPRKTTNPGSCIIIRGKGMPIHKHPDQKGDLYIRFEVEMPNAQWLKNVNIEAVESLLPPKKKDVEPLPAVVDEAEFEESDMVDFGEDESNWEDEDDDDESIGPEPECRQQ